MSTKLEAAQEFRIADQQEPWLTSMSFI